ncbi:MAG: AcrR family transcriptional regulator [Verrucomicrobiales bacterium]|jgi:AcrR family transcriptional regulator
MIPDQGVRLGASERREQLLGAARDTFGSNGFTATSMNDIAVAAGVTKPVLYQHFESKHHLFLEVLTDTAEQLVTAIESAIATSSTGREKIELAFSAYVQFFGSAPANYRVIYGEGVRTEPEFADKHKAIQESLNAFTAEHIDIAGLDHDMRIMAASAIAGQLEAVVGQWLDSGQPHSADAVAKLLSSLAWRGLRGTG